MLILNLLKNIVYWSYPLRMKISRLTGIGVSVQENKNKMTAPQSFYSLMAVENNGNETSFEQFRGKKLLIVNLASECGFTPQYEELQKLNLQNKKLIILGFPSNNFGGQEPLNDKEIFEFCQLNFGVTFPIFKKADVKGGSKQPVYQWLSEKNKNGWNDKEPRWNFYKYLVDEKGNLSGVYSSAVSPFDILPLDTK
jgi:glutathione peroxidase